MAFPKHEPMHNHPAPRLGSTLTPNKLKKLRMAQDLAYDANEILGSMRISGVDKISRDAIVTAMTKLDQALLAFEAGLDMGA